MTAPSDPKALAERLRVPSNSRSFADDAAMREAADALEEVKRERDEAQHWRNEWHELSQKFERDLAAAREALARIADFSDHWERTASNKLCELYPEYESYREALDEFSDAIRLSLRDIARAALSPATKEME